MDSDFLFAKAKHIWARWPNGALAAIILRFRTGIGLFWDVTSALALRAA